MHATVEYNTQLGPWRVDDTLPAIAFTIEKLLDATTWTGVEVAFEEPDGDDMDMGASGGALNVIDATTLLVEWSGDTTKTFVQGGTYHGALTLIAGSRRETMQPFIFVVFDQP